MDRPDCAAKNISGLSEKPRRLAVVFEFPTLSGGERSMLALLAEEPPSDWEVIVVAPGEGPLADEIRTLGLSHLPFDIRGDGNKPPPDWAAELVAEVLEPLNADVVHANSLSMTRITGRLARTRSWTTSGHVRDMMKLAKTAVADINSNAALLCVSEATRQFLVAQGVDSDRTRVVYNGISPSRAARPAGWLRAELAIDASTPLIATVGQICLRKGHDVAVEALSQLGHRDWRWLLIGERFSKKAESAAYDAAIDTTLKAAGLGDRLLRLGYRHDMAEIYPEVDVLLHAARQEPLGRVLLEAGAYQTSVVATDVGGTREIVGEEFALCPPDDPAALAARVEQTLEQPATGLFDASRFQIQQCVEQTWSIWQSVALHAANKSL